VTCYAVVWYVHPDSAMNNIDAALDSCVQNDTVLVGPGTYDENIWWPVTKGICLISEYGPDSTIIDGRTLYRTIYIPPDGPDPEGKIHGFSIKNGLISGGFGAGIYCLRNGFTISRNIITYNYASHGGGGIGCVNSYGAPIIIGNIISKNWADQGGGIYAGTSTTITGNIINGNRAIQGGGLYIGQSVGVILHDNIFMNDSASSGGAIWAYGKATIQNTDFIENVDINPSWRSAGIFLATSAHFVLDSCDFVNNQGHALYVHSQSNATLHNCNIYGNTGYGIMNTTSNIVDAEYNWWGDSTGPYHPDSNPGGLGDTVSDNVDFIPWLYWPGVEEQPAAKSMVKTNFITATIFSGPLLLPNGRSYKVFDITGRVVMPDKMKPGIYFIEVDGKITQKIIKIK